jgi:hypothetical protein
MRDKENKAGKIRGKEKNDGKRDDRSDERTKIEAIMHLMAI